MTEDRAGIIRFIWKFLENFERVLPPEHRVRAMRECTPYVEVIVAGPLMPEAPIEPERVELLLTVRCDEAGCVLTGSFHQLGNPPIAEWEVGRWPSYEGMREFLDVVTPLTAQGGPKK